MIVLLATVVVVCAGIVLVAVGRGGQIAEFIQDAPPGLPERRPIAGTDVALLRLPTGPWGYSYRHTDDALRRIAHALTERDTRIAILEQQVSELRAGLPVAGSTGGGGDPGSPWFDRSEPFTGRPVPISGRTGGAAAIEAPPAEAEPDDTGLDDAPQDDPRAAAPPDDEAPQAATEPVDDAPEDAAADDGAAVTPWTAQRAWTPGAAWTANGSGAKPDEPAEDEPAATEAGEGWAFEDDDAEPEPEPARPSASAFGSSKPAPWPGDRLVASSRPRTEADDTAEENAGTAEDDPEGDAGDTDDEPAGGEPRGEER